MMNTNETKNHVAVKLDTTNLPSSCSISGSITVNVIDLYALYPNVIELEDLIPKINANAVIVAACYVDIGAVVTNR